jgi:hypothetical protein
MILAVARRTSRLRRRNYLISGGVAEIAGTVAETAATRPPHCEADKLLDEFYNDRHVETFLFHDQRCLRLLFDRVERSGTLGLGVSVTDRF